MITLTREEAQQVLDAMEAMQTYTRAERKGLRIFDEAIETLRARLAQPEPEPVADKYLMEVECTKCGAKQDGILTVNTPPQRNWQGLTDEELLACYSNRGNVFYRAIEAKLKEKNT
jgi:hypothetical protein